MLSKEDIQVMYMSNKMVKCRVTKSYWSPQWEEIPEFLTTIFFKFGSILNV